MATCTIPPAIYARLSKDFVDVKKKNLSGFIRWVMSIYQSGYDDGWNQCVDAFMTAGEHFTVDDDVEVEVLNGDDMLTLDDVRDAMLSVKGIGKNRAAKVMDILINGGAVSAR